MIDERGVDDIGLKNTSRTVAPTATGPDEGKLEGGPVDSEHGCAVARFP